VLGLADAAAGLISCLVARAALTHADTPSTFPAASTPPHPHPHPHPQYPKPSCQRYSSYSSSSSGRKSEPTKEHQQQAAEERLRVATGLLVSTFRDELDAAMRNHMGILFPDAAGPTQLDKALQAHTTTDRCARARAVMRLGDGAGSCCTGLGAPWSAPHAC
jgi:hypothetical protein